MPVTTPTPVRVTINGVPSSCASGLGAGCDFTYASGISPSIATVNPTTVNFGAAASLDLVITGTGFGATAAANTVTVGGAPCVVSAASTTSITCTLQAVGTPSGSRTVRARVRGGGRGKAPVCLDRLTDSSSSRDDAMPAG